MSRSMNKAECLVEMERLYLQRAYSDAEMAERLGVDRTTAYRYRIELTPDYFIVQDDTGRWKIDRTRYLSNIRVNLYESLSLYLASRRASQHSQIAGLHAASALEKLSGTLRQPMTDRLVKAADKVLAQKVNPERVAIFETIARGWVERIPVRIHYRGLSARSTTIHHIQPYLIEPSPWSDSVYVIAQSDVIKNIVPFQIKRMQQASLATGQFTLPEDFDEDTLLKHAWGIWSREAEPEIVRLKFAPGSAARRLRESAWHPLETVTDSEDGGCTWEAPIAEWTEMLPWIRGWGADCEVMEPKGLRESLEKETKRLMHLYQISIPQASAPQQRLLRLWGKTGKNELDFHPALFHMIDVGNIAFHLLNMPQSFWRRTLARTFNTSEETIKDWLPWLIALHDIGKISVPFQAQNSTQKARLEREDFSFGQWKPKDKIYHTDIGMVFLRFEFDETNLSLSQQSKLFKAWGEMVGGHHGTFAGLRPTQTSTVSINKHLKSLGEPDEWAQSRQHADQLLRSLFLPKSPEQWPEPENISSAVMALTGFTILCDWLGSDERYFTPHPDIGIVEYAPISRNQAQKALDDSGFFYGHKSKAPFGFSELFPDRVPPRPLQQAIDQIPNEVLQQPCLAIIEAPTGEGKTEAALALGHRIAQYSGTDAFYCALPTQATSNQMFQRLQIHLQKRLGLQAQVKLIHGQAFLVEDDLRPEPLGDVDNTPHPSLEWFGPKKRALLAPFGVGTVDQAELAALNVRHNALRLIGLAGKVVILDEVHAYDTYMTTIIQQMLRWLSALGSSVILLSATLPQSRRAELAEAYGITFESEANLERDYPSLWVGSQNGVHHVSPAAYKPKRDFSLKHLHIPHDDASEKAQWLLDKVTTDGCGCWITNTVARAQQLYDALKLADPMLNIFLLHARFPIEERQKLESDITGQFGPNGKRPQRSIVIGTQVLEQSLDLDFDFMVSDLAPIDLLLQRMGRLHRHEHTRPAAHKSPTLWINTELNPADESQVLMGADRFYQEYILQKTWQTIEGKNIIHLPEDYRPLVEAIYAPNATSADDQLYPAWEKLQRQENIARNKARQYLLPEPDPRRAFCNAGQITFEEDEDSTAWFVAQTRLGAKSITVLPLERDGDKARLYPLDEWVSLTTRPRRDTALRLLRRTLSISHPAVIDYLHDQGNPKETLFREATLLKSVYPLWLENGMLEISTGKKTLKLVLHPEQGLVIEK